MTIPYLFESCKLDIGFIKISEDGNGQARLAAPGWDIYLIESEWRDWLTELPHDVDAAFVGFCKKWAQKRSIVFS